jgi:hypothetical protein
LRRKGTDLKKSVVFQINWSLRGYASTAFIARFFVSENFFKRQRSLLNLRALFRYKDELR